MILRQQKQLVTADLDAIRVHPYNGANPYSA